MVDRWWAETPEDRKEWVRASRKMDNGVRINKWVIERIRIVGARARLSVDVTVATRVGLFKWKDFSEEQTDFWVFEKDDWYLLPLQVSDWDDSQAVEVLVPVPPRKIIIREKK
jgi:hypothetical protein